jgi:hypothetical protein
LITVNRKKVLTGFAVIFIAFFSLSYSCSSLQAQSVITFTPEDHFNISEHNGAVRFAVNGSCSSVMFENGTWIFNELRLNQSQPLGNLKIGAKNSTVIVTSYRAFNSSFRSSFLRYTVEGLGQQTVNLGLNLSRPSHASEWSVIVPNSVFLPEGQIWQRLPDDTVIITGLTGNVSIVRYNFNFPYDDHLPFYLRHSVAILTAAILASVVAFAILIKVRERR